ncbi:MULTISPECIES: cation diffusion facilitator family transporter [Brevibacterium]|uniref:Cation diffusion facilitator family transporter n=1 Tax=Brevibacterium salitolerans TaxID=1403566 RepID=A0ABN2X094_9MICO|nr:cation transporter [Brevibacterium sp.]
MDSEKKALTVSLTGILTVAALGIGFGLLSGSYAIAFDGMISLVDAIMSLVSIQVAGLITRSLLRGPSSLFGVGYWHLEPFVLALNALLMMAVTGYALVQAVLALFSGGRAVEFGPAVVYAVVVVILTVSFAVVEHRANRKIGSALVAMDVKGWIMTGGVTGALLLAFVLGAVLDARGQDQLTPYVDPAVLVLVAIVLLPIPVPTLRRAVREIALVTPSSLRAEAEAVAERTAHTHGFSSSAVYPVQVGRSRQVEIVFLVPEKADVKPLQEWDRIRREVGAELGAEDPNNWITVAFTTDPQLL